MRTWVQRLRVSAFAVVCSASLVLPLPRAQAEPSHAVDAAGDARRYFSEGSALYLAKRYAEALEALRSSYRLVPSPNSGLLIARSLRELNRPGEALETYGEVVEESQRRAAEGDAKYTQTSEAAASEAAALRASLGVIRIRVLDPRPGTRLEVDDVAVPLSADKDFVMWHAPGAAKVRFRPATGVEQTQVVSVAAGGELRMEFNVAPQSNEPALPPEKNAPAPPPSWAIPAAWISGGVAVVGLGVFTGFGLRSQSIYRDLSNRCGPASCGPADRADATAGQRDQTIANVGLVVAGVGALATAIFVVLGTTPSSGPPGAASAPKKAKLLVGPGVCSLNVPF
ncbi:MAG: CDC27 family protein [Polyangiaceae bacterium]